MNEILSFPCMIEWAKKCNIPIGFRKPLDCTLRDDSINSLEREQVEVDEGKRKTKLRPPLNGIL